MVSKYFFVHVYLKLLNSFFFLNLDTFVCKNMDRKFKKMGPWGIKLETLASYNLVCWHYITSGSERVESKAQRQRYRYCDALFWYFILKSYIINVLVPICIIYLYNGTGPWVNNSQAFILTWCHKHLTIVSPANTLDLIFVIVYCCKGGENK